MRNWSNSAWFWISYSLDLFWFDVNFFLFQYEFPNVLPCDLEVTDSSRGNNFLQCRVRLCQKKNPMWSNPSLGSCIGGSFVHRIALYEFPNILILSHVCILMSRLSSVISLLHKWWLCSEMNHTSLSNVLHELKSSLRLL